MKIISQTGKIARNINIEECTRRNIAIVEGIGSSIAAAELTWLLIMAAKRKFVSSVNSMKNGNWQTNIGECVNKQVLGILGYGKIGKLIAKYAKAFDMSIQVWGSERAQYEAKQDGLLVPQNRQEFFQTSDIITIHQRLTEQTKANITFEDLNMMKKNSWFVNTSRAALVAKDALYKALSNGRPGYAALDVYEAEPIYDTNNIYLQMPNILCTPHIGYVEKSSYDIYFKSAFENIIKFFKGDKSHVINL